MRPSWRARGAPVLLACVAGLWLASIAVTGNGAELTGSAWTIALGVPHAVVYTYLFWRFARTLRAGTDPLVTRIARRVHGTLTPDIVSYTGRVTMAWCVFFAAQLAGSAMLLAFAAPDVWALFVTALNVPLVALMFVGEYWYRARRYPDHPRTSIANSIRAFGRTGSASTGTEARRDPA